MNPARSGHHHAPLIVRAIHIQPLTISPTIPSRNPKRSGTVPRSVISRLQVARIRAARPLGSTLPGPTNAHSTAIPRPRLDGLPVETDVLTHQCTYSIFIRDVTHRVDLLPRVSPLSAISNDPRPDKNSVYRSHTSADAASAGRRRLSACVPASQLQLDALPLAR